MATSKQKKVAKIIVESLRTEQSLTGGEIVESSGYGPSMKKNPQVVLNSVGVQEELRIVYGFNNETADNVVLEILTAGESDMAKLKAADTIYKRTGGYAAEKHINLNVNKTITDEEALKAAESAYLQHLDGTARPT